MFSGTLDSQVPVNKGNVKKQGQIFSELKMKLPVDTRVVLRAMIKHLFSEINVSSYHVKNRTAQ